VVIFDVRGIGSLGPGYLKGDAYIDNTSFNQWFAGILTNKSIVAMRAEDIIRIAHFVKTDINWVETLSAIAVGATGSELLHAAAFDETIDKVCFIEPFLSFADIALSPDYSPAFIPSSVAGAIEKYDLPDLLASLSPRKILIINPLASDGTPALESKRKCYKTYPTIVYTQKGVKNNFKHSVIKGAQLVNKQVIDWLK
jgi:hypothetical protein